MNMRNTLPSFLFTLLAGMIFLFSLIVIFYILLFSIRLTLSLGGTKTFSKFSKAGMVTHFYFYNTSTKPSAIQVDTEFDKTDLLAKVARKISSDYRVYRKISWKKWSLTIGPLKVDPKDNAWDAKAKVQIRDEGLEDIILDEKSYVLTCKQLNDSCILITSDNQNGLSVQNLQLRDAVQILIQTLSSTSQKAAGVESTDTSESRKTKEKTEAYPSHKE